MPSIRFPFTSTDRLRGRGGGGGGEARGSGEGGPDRTLCSHLRKENHQALVVGEFEVLGVKVMESRNVTLNQILLLVV